MRTLSVLLTVLSLIFTTACNRVETQLFVVNATNATKRTTLIRVSGNNQAQILNAGNGYQYKVHVPCTRDNRQYYGVTNSPPPCVQNITVVAVDVNTHEVSRDFSARIDQTQIFDVTIREGDFGK